MPSHIHTQASLKVSRISAVNDVDNKERRMHTGCQGRTKLDVNVGSCDGPDMRAVEPVGFARQLIQVLKRKTLRVPVFP